MIVEQIKHLWRFGVSTLVTIGIIASFVFAQPNGPYPSVGLYWIQNSDPTTGAGVEAPLNQLLIRTDAPSIYYKSGSAKTAWTRLGQGAATVSDITATYPITISSDAGVYRVGVDVEPDGGIIVVSDGGLAVDPNLELADASVSTLNILTGLKFQGALVMSAGGVSFGDAGIGAADIANELRYQGNLVFGPAGSTASLLVNGVPVAQGSGLYGDGSDGVCAYDGSTVVAGVTPAGNVYTMTRPAFCTTATLSTGITIAGKYPLYTSVGLVVNGSGNVENDGNPGLSNGTPGGAITDGYFGDPIGSGDRASPAQAGGAGGNTDGVAAGASNPVCRGQQTGGTGGNGASGVGGAGSTLTAIPEPYGDCRDWPSFRSGFMPKMAAAAGTAGGFWTSGGGGGGGGTNVGGGVGGGGGGGGASIEIFARTISGSGTNMFHAIGGAGGSPPGVAGCIQGGNGCGGGGGGSGGFMIIVFGSFSGSGCTMTAGSCYSVGGGTGGIHQGTGTNGGSGGTGIATIVQAN